MTLSPEEKSKYNKLHYQKNKKQQPFKQKFKRIRSEEYKIHNKQYKVVQRAVQKYKSETEIYQPSLFFFRKSDYRKYNSVTEKQEEIGLGLHALKDFKKDTIVQFYIGVKESLEVFNLKKLNNNERNYAILLPNNYVLNCFNSYHCQASLANTISNLIHKKTGKSARLNARIVVNNSKCLLKKVSIQSTKDISKGEEIFVPYNRSFFNN